MKNLSDHDIIESVRKGNNADYTLLIRRYKDRAFSMLKRMLKNNEDAEEVLQDAFVKAFYALPKFKAEASFSTWFYKIVYNTGLSALGTKSGKMKKVTDTAENEDNYGIVNYQLNEQAEEKINLYKIIDQLPVKNALVIILYYIDGLSLKEISEVLDLSLVNTKVILHRSREKLKEIILQNNYAEFIK